MTLIEAVQSTIGRLHYSPRTEKAYLHWNRAYIRFHGGRHPRDMGAPEMTAFLNHLAVQRRVSASTQNQALCALVLLSRRVLGLKMPGLEGLERARRPEHLPAVLSCPEVLAVLDKLDSPFRLIGEILYGSWRRPEGSRTLCARSRWFDDYPCAVGMSLRMRTKWICGNLPLDPVKNEGMPQGHGGKSGDGGHGGGAPGGSPVGIMHPAAQAPA